MDYSCQTKRIMVKNKNGEALENFRASCLTSSTICSVSTELRKKNSFFLSLSVHATYD